MVRTDIASSRTRIYANVTMNTHASSSWWHAGAFFRQSSFATHAIASERNVLKVDKDLPLEVLAPLGCGIQTGAGAILNTFQCKAGSTLGALNVNGSRSGSFSTSM